MTQYKTIRIRERIEDDYIIWDGIYKLKKSDFNGPIRNNKTAETASKKLFEADGEITSIDEKHIQFKITRIKVIAIASREHSWMNDDFVKKQDIDEILQHEQLHFMVEEAFSRKLEQKINEEIKRNFQVPRIESLTPEESVRNAIQFYLNERRNACQKITEKYQKDYDDAVHDEMNYRIPEKQKEWDEKIRKLLEEL